MNLLADINSSTFKSKSNFVTFFSNTYILLLFDLRKRKSNNFFCQKEVILEKLAMQCTTAFHIHRRVVCVVCCHVTAIDKQTPAGWLSCLENLTLSHHYFYQTLWLWHRMSTLNQQSIRAVACLQHTAIWMKCENFTCWEWFPIK